MSNEERIKELEEENRILRDEKEYLKSLLSGMETQLETLTNMNSNISIALKQERDKKHAESMDRTSL